MRRSLLSTILLLLLAAMALPASAHVADAPASAALTNRAIFFASDGMRPDLMEKYAAAGASRHTSR